MKKIQEDAAFKLQLVATGSHLSQQHGYTVNEIKSDGFSPDELVEMLVAGDTPTCKSLSVGLGTTTFTGCFDRLKPDLLLILGDRFEIFAAATAAMMLGIPIGHIHGGEVTLGAIDEQIRHAISKMSHLHFTSAEPYRQRVIQMGESPELVFNVGAPAVENIKSIDFLSQEEVEKALNFHLKKTNYLVTFHPETLADIPGDQQVKELLAALDESKDTGFIFTMPNCDAEGLAVLKEIEKFVDRNKNRACLHDSLGKTLYLSTMKLVNTVVGNSSSGIIEAPVLGIPSVNIGERQGGRARTDAIIDCPCERKAIYASLTKALALNVGNTALYGEGNTSTEIVNILKTTDFGTLKRKRFNSLIQS